MVAAKKVEWSAGLTEERGLSQIRVEEYRGDEASAARIIEITAEVGWGKYRGGADKYAAHFRRELREKGRRIFLAKVGNAVVAYAEVVCKKSETWAVGEGEAYLFAVAVTPAHARSGLARALVKLVTDELRAQGTKTLLSDVRWDNAASMKLAENSGARIAGPSPAAVVETAGGVPHLRFALAL